MRDTIDMAREAGWTSYDSQDERFKAFAELVRADERNRTWTQEHWTEYERSIAAPVQEPVAWLYKDDWGRTKIAFSKETANEWGSEVRPLYTTPPAAQPAVPDAFGTREGEHPQYVQGWNDCRAEMLKGMKP